MQALSERDLEVLKKEQDLILFEERIADKTRVCLYTQRSHCCSERLYCYFVILCDDERNQEIVECISCLKIEFLFAHC